jgi:hypothetical protein
MSADQLSNVKKPKIEVYQKSPRAYPVPTTDIRFEFLPRPFSDFVGRFTTTLIGIYIGYYNTLQSNSGRRSCWFCHKCGVDNILELYRIIV